MPWSKSSMSQQRIMDAWLKERLDRYDKWLSERKIPFSSKVVPVAESLQDRHWILPTEQVLRYLQDARSFAVADCVCRRHYQRCDHPVDVCIFLNEASDKLVDKGDAVRLPMGEMAEKLRRANEHGLVHLTLYSPWQYPFAICSCCPCCCHDLQLLLDYHRKELVACSQYVAVQSDERCTHCGICVERCVFEARSLENGRLCYQPNQCYGCGLCTTTCPGDAIQLERNHNIGSNSA